MPTYLDRVVAMFMAYPHEWIDGRELAIVGGAYAWRTRVSECRTKRGMVIQNRERRGRRYIVSEYRWIPSDYRLESQP